MIDSKGHVKLGDFGACVKMNDKGGSFHAYPQVIKLQENFCQHKLVEHLTTSVRMSWMLLIMGNRILSKLERKSITGELEC